MGALPTHDVLILLRELGTENEQLKEKNCRLEVALKKMSEYSTHYSRLYWHAYHHPFRFFFTALFHKKWSIK